MKIDDVAKSNLSPKEKAKQAIIIWNQVESWCGKVDIQEQLKKEDDIKHTLQMVGILCSNVIPELDEINKEVENGN